MKNYTLTEIVDNYEQIGSGFSAGVFLKDPYHVFRISAVEKDGWRTLCYLSPKERAQFSLPSILRWWTDPESGYLIAIVEKLNRLNYSDYKDNLVNLEVFNRFGGPPNVDDVMEVSDAFYSVAKKAVDLFNYCSTRGHPLRSLDLNRSNILKRGDGTLILNDVLGSRDI